MDREQIKDVMREVFGRSFEMKDLGSWVGMRCPLAPWTHEKGHDSSPSAGVSVDPNGSSVFNCFTCKNPGPFGHMLSKYAEYSGENLDELIEEVTEGEFLGPRSMPSYDQVRRDREQEVAMPIDEGLFMDLYDPAAGHPYLRERGISDATANKLELLFDPKDSANEPRILFPVRGPDGLLYGFSGRATRRTAELKVRDYCGLAKSHCVLGSHLATTARRVVLVEGLVDYAVCHEYGEAGCAVMHSTFTEWQAAILKGLGRPTYLMYDNDKAGISGNALAARQLVGHMPVLQTHYPRVRVEDSSEQGWHWLNDPGEMLQEEFLGMLRQASLI